MHTRSPSTVAVASDTPAAAAPSLAAFRQAVPWPRAACCQLGPRRTTLLVQILQTYAVEGRPNLAFEEVFGTGDATDRAFNERNVFTARAAAAELRRMKEEAQAGALGTLPAAVVDSIAASKLHLAIDPDRLFAAWAALVAAGADGGPAQDDPSGGQEAEAAKEGDPGRKGASGSKTAKDKKRAPVAKPVFPPFEIRAVAVPETGKYRLAAKEDLEGILAKVADEVYPLLRNYAAVADGALRRALAQEHLEEWLAVGVPKIAQRIEGARGAAEAWWLFCEWVNRRSVFTHDTGSSKVMWLAMDVWRAGATLACSQSEGGRTAFPVLNSKRAMQDAYQCVLDTFRNLPGGPRLNAALGNPQLMFQTAWRAATLRAALLRMAKVKPAATVRRSFVLHGREPGETKEPEHWHDYFLLLQAQARLLANWDALCSADGRPDPDRVRRALDPHEQALLSPV